MRRWDLTRRLLTLDGARARPRVHPLYGPELPALGALRPHAPPVHVFVTKRGGPMTPAGFRNLLVRCGAAAGIDFPVHPQMLRHACRLRLESEGDAPLAIRDYLGLRI